MKNKLFEFTTNATLKATVKDTNGKKEYYIEGYASTVDKDLAGEIINYNAQESLLKQFRNRNITIDIEHESWFDDDGKQLSKPKGGHIPVAKVIEAKQDSKGTWIKAEMNNHIERFSEIWGSIKGGFLNSFSIGFFPITQVGNVISDLNIVNLTLTGTPVNADATFTPVLKSAVAYLKSIEQVPPKPTIEPVAPKEPAPIPSTPPTPIEPVIPAKPATIPPVEPTPKPVDESTNGLKTEAEIKQEAIDEAEKKLAELKLEPSAKTSNDANISDMIGKIMDQKFKEWEERMKKNDAEPTQAPEADLQKLKDSQEVPPSKPITPLGMIKSHQGMVKAFKKRQGELGSIPKLKALTEEIPIEATNKEKTKSPLQLIN